jgi:outer membrane protein assembly factor BamB
LVGAANKNGVYYAFDRTDIGSGPLWRAQIAVGGACPQCGKGSISSSAWDGTMLYVAGGNTTINGNNCKGSLRALDPSTGHFIWEHCLNEGTVLGAVTVVPGVVAAVVGPDLVLVDATSGKALFAYRGLSVKSHFYGSPSISNGVLYIGNKDSRLYALGT